MDIAHLAVGISVLWHAKHGAYAAVITRISKPGPARKQRVEIRYQNRHGETEWSWVYPESLSQQGNRDE
jgi:hypothetical protein